MKNIKLKTYKKVDLFYNERDGRVYFNFEGEELNTKYVFEAERIIDEPIWEACDLKGYFIDGTFSDYIGKAVATRKDIKSGKPEWKYQGKYDVQPKIPNYSDHPKVYLLTEKNSQTYGNFQVQREISLKEERKLKEIISKLV